LVDRTLPACDAARVTDAILSAVEMVAYDDHISCLMCLIFGAVAVTPFEQRGYAVIMITGLFGATRLMVSRSLKSSESGRR